MKKVVIAGGTGFIGKYLSQRFNELGFEVLIVSRRSGNISWDQKSLVKAINNAELVINLAGKSINCRHTAANKTQLIESRITSTLLLGKAIQACQNPPKLWINSSATGIYKPSKSTPATENSNDIGTDFLAKLVTQWESTFFKFKLENTRQIALRTSVVLGKDGGALKPLTILSKVGLGGKQASGMQMFSWIHIEDYFNIILFAFENKSLSAVINCSSPYPVRNKDLMKSIVSEINFIPFGIPAPEFIIKIGALILGTEASLLLNSSFIKPQKLIEVGYNFRFPKIAYALKNLIDK